MVPLFRVLFRLRVSGTRFRRPQGRGVIIAPNHESYLDPAVVQYAVLPHQITFLMTELFFDLPVAGLYFRACGNYPIREDGPSVAGLRAAKKLLNEGRVICMFPEGEITETGELGPGLRGVARMARRTGAIVIPVGVHGTINVLSKVQKSFRLAPVHVRLGKPMEFNETPDRDGEQRFTDRLMATIRSLAE